MKKQLSESQKQVTTLMQDNTKAQIEVVKHKSTSEDLKSQAKTSASKIKQYEESNGKLAAAESNLADHLKQLQKQSERIVEIEQLRANAELHLTQAVERHETALTKQQEELDARLREQTEAGESTLQKQKEAADVTLQEQKSKVDLTLLQQKSKVDVTLQEQKTKADFTLQEQKKTADGQITELKNSITNLESKLAASKKKYSAKKDSEIDILTKTHKNAMNELSTQNALRVTGLEDRYRKKNRKYTERSKLELSDNFNKIANQKMTEELRDMRSQIGRRDPTTEPTFMRQCVPESPRDFHNRSWSTNQQTHRQSNRAPYYSPNDRDEENVDPKLTSKRQTYGTSLATWSPGKVDAEFIKLGINQFMESFKRHGLDRGSGLTEVTSYEDIEQLEIEDKSSVKLSVIQCRTLFTAMNFWKKGQ
jgi:chromosome segregation ATPase